MSAVPAWKRLGLKLKGPSADGSPVSTVAQTTTPSAPPAARPSYRQQQSSFNSGGFNGGYDNGTPFNKRKQQFPGSYPSSDNKRSRREDSNFTPSKKVSFSQDTKKAGSKKPKKKKAPKPQKPKEPFDFTPVIEYLRTWDKARDNWKFNKNHQTLLIKYIYQGYVVPSSDIDTFYRYIGDIKGASRQRLVEQAKDIIKKDMEAGPKGFLEGTKAPEDKQKQYEEVLADLLEKKAEIKDGATINGNGKRSFNEVDFVLRTTDKTVQQRVVKRMRAETIADELDSSDSSESTDVSTTITTNASPSKVKGLESNDVANVDVAKVLLKPKAARKKKLRTGDSDSSSSEDSDSSDSDSDSDTPADTSGVKSSESSSSESDSDEEMTTGNDVPNADASSSSSSSSSDSGSGSEDEGVASPNDDDSGSDGDSESSDDEDA